MRTRLRSKVTLLFVVSALLLAIPAVAALAQDTGTSTSAPTIQSDKADYAPGELVTLTGSGWQPGESVNVFVNDEEGQTWSRNVDVTADESGNITDQFNLPDWFVATYKVTATGELSGVATTSFTDGNIWAKTSGLSIPIILHWEKFNTNTNCSGFPDFSQGTLMPPNTPQLLTGVDDGQSIRMTLLGGPLGEFVNWTSGSEERTDLRICVAGSTAEQVWTANYGAAPTSVDTTITASNASATYGASSVQLNATVTPTSGTAAVNTGTVTFTVKNSAGTTIGNPVTSGTVSNGSASESFPLSGVNADTYTIEAAYNAGTGFNASNNSTQSPAPTLTFNKAETKTTVTCGADPFTYTGSPHTPCTAKVTGPGGLDQSLPVDYQNNTNAGQATASASYAETANYLGSSDSKTFTIGKKELTASFTAENKVYDGNDSANIATRTLQGVVDNEDVSLDGGTAKFNDKNVADGKTVTATDFTLAGTAKDNYTLKAGPWTTQANITAKELTGSFTAENKTYDGNTDATVTNRTLNGTVSGDTIDLTGGTASFDNKNVATGKTVTLSGASLSGTDAGNYKLSSVETAKADITAKSVTGSFTAADKTYDGNIDATITGRSLNSADVINGDDVNLSGGTATFGTAAAGTGKTVTGTGFTLAGADAGNYKLVSTTLTTTANIKEKELTGSFTAANKTYDGTTAATINGRSVSGKVGNDDVKLDGGTATFGSANAETGKTVTATGFTLAGTAKDNYILKAGPWTTTADISPATLTITAANQSKKLGDPNPTFTASYSGFVNSEDKSVLDGTLTFATNVPDPEQVGTWDITPSGLTSSNYSINFVKGTLTITYKFDGFRSPVDNPGTDATPVFNSAKAGQSIPVKFGLGGNQGLNIIAAGYPKVTSVNCVSSATVNPIEQYAASTAEGGLTYDASADQYNYIWKTQSTYVNKCFKFDLQLTDGTSHVAYFKFLK